MHKDSIKKGARVVVVDDVLATGGTAKASADLVAGQGGDVVAYAFVIELGFLSGRKVLEGRRVESVLTY
jgi:adenine phosphoribosyltransferase